MIPRTIESPYPFNREPRMLVAESGDCLESLRVIAFLAGFTA